MGLIEGDARSILLMGEVTYLARITVGLEWAYLEGIMYYLPLESLVMM